MCAASSYRIVLKGALCRSRHRYAKRAAHQALGARGLTAAGTIGILRIPLRSRESASASGTAERFVPFVFYMGCSSDFAVDDSFGPSVREPSAVL